MHQPSPVWWHLAGIGVPPAWNGASHLHLKLSAGDEDDPPEQAVPTKACSTCKRELPLTASYFFRNSRAKSGFLGDCKDCHTLRNLESEQRRRDRKKVLQPGDFERLGGAA